MFALTLKEVIYDLYLIAIILFININFGNKQLGLEARQYHYAVTLILNSGLLNTRH